MNAGIMRPPRHPLLLSCFLGTGTQLVCCGALALVTAPLFGHDNDDRPRRIFCLTIYSAGSLIGGYVSCRLLKQSGRACDWVACVHVTCALFTAPCLLLCPPTKLIATAWLFIGYPLTVLGAIAANHSAPSTFDARLGNGATAVGRAHKGGSCSLWRLSRDHLIAGLLAFACLAAPLYYTCRIGCTERPSDSFLMAHAAFGLASAAMVVATASVTLTYGELSDERLEWCWRCAYGVAAPAAALLLLYVLFLGWFFSTTAFCWYNGQRAVQFLAGALLASCGVLLALGAVGFWATLSFVRYVQRAIKSD